jgi:hypothetical protein
VPGIDFTNDQLLQDGFSPARTHSFCASGTELPRDPDNALIAQVHNNTRTDFTGTSRWCSSPTSFQAQSMLSFLDRELLRTFMVLCSYLLSRSGEWRALFEDGRRPSVL